MQPHPRTLDRILSVETGRSARALRNVPNTLGLLDSHFPRFPVLPGVLILECLAELGQVAVAGAPGAWRLAGAERVRFRRYVRPGDQMELAVDVTQHDASTATVKGDVRVRGRVVASVHAIRLVPEPPAP